MRGRNFVGFGLALLAPIALAQAQHQSYPETRRVEQVDNYHGTDVHDPYRWLEADVREDEEVAAWVETQNELTDAYLAQIPERDRIRPTPIRRSISTTKCGPDRRRCVGGS